MSIPKEAGESAATPVEAYDYLPAIQTFYPMGFPAEPGKHTARYQATGHTYSSTGKAFNHYVEIDTTLDMVQISAPPAVSSIKLLKDLPYLKAYLKAAQELQGEVINPETKEVQVIPLEFDAISITVVPAESVLKALWKAYKVNIYSLRAALTATRFQESSADWGKVTTSLAMRAFGHQQAPKLDDADPIGWIPELLRSSADSCKSVDPFAKGPSDQINYYRLKEIYNLVAFLELMKAGDVKLDLPSSDCFIEFPEDGAERASVWLLDTWEAPKGPALPLEVRKEYGAKTADLIREFFRYRKEIMEIREQRRNLFDKTFHLWMGPDSVDILVDETVPNKRDTILEANALYIAEREVQDKARPLYVELTHWTAKHKERVLKATREREVASIKVQEGAKAVKGLVQLPSNMGKLPAHFAAIPAGLETGLHMETDQYGRAILRVRRQSLDIVGGTPPQEQKEFTLPLVGTDAEQSALIKQADLLLGHGGPRWLIPQGVVAISKLYSDLGGYSGAESTVRIYENDWVDTMRPGQVERFRQKGRTEAFGQKHRPKDMFNALLGVLSRLTYDSETKHPVTGWSELNGFYLILANGEDSRGRWTEVMLNPALHKFISGDGGLPYMVTNTKAMFEYSKESLDYAPAAQMGLEQLARINIYKRNTSTLSDPQGGGLTRLTFANCWGILRGPSEKNKDVMLRFNRTLDNLGKAGVISEVKVDGVDKGGTDAFGVKLLITMHDDYRKSYDLSRDKEVLRNLDKQLATPFAEPKKLKSTRPAPAAKKRGRPAKNNK